MEGLGVGDIRTEARGAWLFDRIVTTGSVVLSTVGGSEAGTAAAHRYLSSPHTSVGAILRAFGARTAQACAGRAVWQMRNGHPAAAAGFVLLVTAYRI
ncbi:hypothetical protein MKK69_04630 [Methylobacterium sp. J-026]|uniref:hypothetical protein n=1 Tax=Methylobacterium sp. J-026 TaxID=2836624 RepID=UPI001FBC130E|nr:hypothetical protein [Methylobacterium sp. J-026]MCJ2133353.1 hypothetical protein [Methylobacterium sp. J-026]